MREVTVSCILGPKTRCHTISIHLLLLVTAAHGIAPDRHSLASLRGLHVLWSIQIPREFAGDEDASPEEDVVATEEDESVSRLLARGIRGPAASTVRVIDLDPLRSRCPRGDLPTPDRLSIVLCRLTC
jgi:hypothetical protein